VYSHFASLLNKYGISSRNAKNEEKSLKTLGNYREVFLACTPRALVCIQFYGFKSAPEGEINMKLLRLSIIASFLFVTSLAFAAPGLETARVLAVKAHDHGRIAVWEGHVPVYDNYPFYDITLQIGQKKYVTRYETTTGYYPSSWKADSEIQVRLEGRGRMSLVNGSEEVLVDIVTNYLNDCVPSNTPLGRIHSSPEVPCE
jgi:hypothetical protein